MLSFARIDSETSITLIGDEQLAAIILKDDPNMLRAIAHADSIEPMIDVVRKPSLKTKKFGQHPALIAACIKYGDSIPVHTRKAKQKKASSFSKNKKVRDLQRRNGAKSKRNFEFVA